jgi:hypothetical protein
VALSRVATSSHIKVLVEEGPGQGVYEEKDEDGEVVTSVYTANVVWPEALLNSAPANTAVERSAREPRPESSSGVVGEAPIDDRCLAEDAVDQASGPPRESGMERDGDGIPNDFDEFGSDPSSTFLAGQLRQVAQDEEARKSGAMLHSDAVRQHSREDQPIVAAVITEPLDAAADVAPVPTVYAGYFERQVLARCGLHALNNAIGAEFFTAEDMTFACTAYIAEARFEGNPERRADHEAPSGWYSEAVLAHVIRWKIAQFALGRHAAMRLDVNNPLRTTLPSARRIFADQTVGVLVNKDQVHWVAFKCVAGEIWLLDSEQQPLLYSFGEYMAFLQVFRHAFCILREGDT